MVFFFRTSRRGDGAGFSCSSAFMDIMSFCFSPGLNYSSAVITVFWITLLNIGSSFAYSQGLPLIDLAVLVVDWVIVQVFYQKTTDVYKRELLAFHMLFMSVYVHAA